MTPINFWDHKFAGHTDDANAEIKQLFGDKVFDTPKPVQLVRRMLELGTAADEEAIVLDFFAGSCSTAVAVAVQNAADGGNRRFIAVQIPEPIPPTARKAGLADLAQLGRERIKRAMQQLATEETARPLLDASASKQDTGFRVFQLRESSFRQWNGIPTLDAQSANEQFALFVDPLIPGWDTDAVLFEVALKEGFSLSSSVQPITKTQADDNTVFLITDAKRNQKLMMCLDSSIQPDLAKRLSLTATDRLICRDVALSDELAANLALQCHLKTI
jgi:adenine-specific DNA-methyltransferase